MPGMYVALSNGMMLTEYSEKGIPEDPVPGIMTSDLPTSEIMHAEMVVFISDTGEVVMMKNRHGATGPMVVVRPTPRT